MSEREPDTGNSAPGSGIPPAENEAQPPREAEGVERAPSPSLPPEVSAAPPSEPVKTPTSEDSSTESPRTRLAMEARPEVWTPANARSVVAPRPRLHPLAEPPEIPVEVARAEMNSQSRRDFLLFTLGLAATAAGSWWLLPDRTKARLLPEHARDRLDTLAARVGLTRQRRESALDGALTFDDDIAETLYSKDRRVRTYDRSQVTALRNNYDGMTPGPEYLPTWTLALSGLASGHRDRLTIDRLLREFAPHEQVTRLVCVEGWSAIAWWGGIRFADLLAAYPPAPGARWAALRSSVNLDLAGRSDPYYVSIDLETARHPQTLLATHQGGQPLTLAHGAPLRLLAPMKLGLKNIKAITEIAYGANEPPDYWNQRGYSKYDGL